jgi:hypothetical protein
MKTLKFDDSRDGRDLIEILIEATKIARDESPLLVHVAGRTYQPHDLQKLVELLPDEDLLPRHESMIDGIFQKKQRGYRRTARNLITRVYQLQAEVVHRTSMSAVARVFKHMHHAEVESRPFMNRGLSDRTIKALLDCGIDAPERLLSMSLDDLRKIPGIGKMSLAEIDGYRARFRAPAPGLR